jgi:SAM-dependent methyltransferase
VTHDCRFPFEKAHRLDDPERLREQPPEPVIAALELGPESRVLDLGVGTGYFAVPIASRLAAIGGAGRVLGLDIEPRMLELLRQHALRAGIEGRIDALALDGDDPDRLPLDDASLDRALLVGLYHELERPGAILAELRRVLRADGLLLIVDWSPLGRLDKGPPLEHRVPAARIEEALRRAGFADIASLPLYADHNALRASAA